MSVGLQLLRACIDNGSRSEFRQLSPVLFVADEVPVYEAVAAHYRRHGQLPSVDTMQELGFRLPNAPEPPAFYLNRTRNRAIFNTITAQNTDLANAMRDRDMERAVQILRETSFAVNRFEAVSDVATLHELAGMVMEDFEAARGGGNVGVTLGYSYLDEITNGAEGGDVITIVARPGMGKSYTLSHMARASWLSGASVLFVSMEMTAKQITRRIVGMEAGINPDFLRRGQISTARLPAVYDTVRALGNGPPFHLLQGSFEKSVGAVDAAIQELAPDIVYIDASYLMAPSSNKGQKKPNELIADVGKEVKETAMARNKPIVQSVQFNREQRKTKGSPDLIHIGGSDAIGQISTIVMAIEAGEAPFEKSTRKMSLLKSRESTDDVAFLTNFQFNPPDFSFLRALNTEEDNDEASGPQSDQFSTMWDL